MNSCPESADAAFGGLGDTGRAYTVKAFIDRAFVVNAFIGRAFIDRAYTGRTQALAGAQNIESLWGQLAHYSEVFMETRVAVIAIIIEKEEAAEGVNNILHTYRRYIIGRMGIPYREKAINIISVAVDAPEPEITAMSGKIGRLNGVSTKTAYSKV